MATKFLSVVLGTIMLVYATEIEEDESVEITCTHEGKTYAFGAEVGDPCHPCLCEMTGEMVCSKVTCMVAQCADSKTEPKECCSWCPNGDNCKFGKHFIPRGDTIDLADQVCTCPSDLFSLKRGKGSAVYQAECTRK